jgi:hypothetical protein
VGSSKSTSEKVRPAGSWHPSAAQSGAEDTANDGGAKWTDDVVLERCSECGLTIEEYTAEDIGLCIIILGTFMHGEPNLASPMLPEILRIVAKFADKKLAFSIIIDISSLKGVAERGFLLAD